MVSDYNTRCRNKFLRIEIGIAPQDEKKLSVSELAQIAHLFAKKMGLDNHQWVAVTHKDTDNRHIHIIANRISLYGEVYDTTFVSNKAARITEEISREKRLTIAKEVKIKRKHQKSKANPTREEAKKELQRICYTQLEKYKSTGITGHSMFLYELNKHGVTIERMKNKQSKVYGLKFSYGEYAFKASEVGREFGYRSLQKNFEAGKKADTNISDQVNTQNRQSIQILRMLAITRNPQAVHNSLPPTKETPKIAQTIRDMADAAISTADDLVEGVGGMITPTTHGDDYAETAWQRKLRNQANRKKKRGRGL